jgi:hypothetical protein
MHFMQTHYCEVHTLSHSYNKTPKSLTPPPPPSRQLIQAKSQIIIISETMYDNKHYSLGLYQPQRGALELMKMHCSLNKKISDFPVPSRDVSNQTLPDREKLIYSRPVRVWLVTSWLGTGKSLTFFTVWGFTSP